MHQIHPVLRKASRGWPVVAAGCAVGFILAITLAAPFFALADRAKPCRMVTIGGAMQMGCDSSRGCVKPACERHGRPV